MDLFSNLDTMTPDNLMSSGSVPVLVKAVTLKAAQGNIARGSVLGIVKLTVGAIAADEGNTGDAAIAAATLADNVQTGTYTIGCVTAPSGAAANDAVFAVFAPDGSRLADSTQGVAYAGGHLIFTIGNATAADSVVGDLYTVTVGAGSGLAVLVDSSKHDGSQEADCILTDYVATGADGATDNIVAEAYRTGHFNRQALIFGGTDTAGDHEARLRELGIHLSDHIAY